MYVGVCGCMWVYVGVCGCMWVYVGVCSVCGFGGGEKVHIFYFIFLKKKISPLGLGASAAILDAVELAECLIDDDDDDDDSGDGERNNKEVISKKLRDYERKMEK